MASSLKGTRVIALLSNVLAKDLREHLTRLGIHLAFAHNVAQLSRIRRDDRAFEVAIVPADPPAGEWLQLCHELTCLKPRPSILVSFKRDTFKAWAQVLDSGGFGVIIEPYTTNSLQNAIQGAVDHFHGYVRPDKGGRSKGP